MEKRRVSTRTIVFVALMAAIIFVVTELRVPFFGTKLHFANGICLLSGLLLGGVPGGFAAALGSWLYDVIMGGYDVLEGAVTAVNKFAIAFVCWAVAAYGGRRGNERFWVVAGSVIGALCYVALYMLKTWLYHHLIYGFPMETVIVTMGTKLPGSLINAAAAMVTAPVLYFAVKPAINRVLARG